jgi:hypothetical protein
MTSKSEICYNALFNNIKVFAENLGFNLRPAFIITEFERAAIKAIRNTFPGTQNKGCLFHLSQIIFRKIQSLRLTNEYKENNSLRVRQLAALAFLPSDQIPNAFQDIIVSSLRNDIRELVKWFAINYVTGDRRFPSPPSFKPLIWSVFENNELGFPRTTNHCEDGIPVGIL